MNWHVVTTRAIGLLLAMSPAVPLATREAAAATVEAYVVALDQPIVYNRFGSLDPFGMMFALARDVVPFDAVGRPGEGLPDPSGGAEALATACADRLGTESWWDEAKDDAAAKLGRLRAGQVRLQPCKRPRPLVLRVSAGDRLEVTVKNLLRPLTPTDPALDFSGDFCRQPVPSHLAKQCARRDEERAGGEDSDAPDWPSTRTLSLTVPGLRLVAEGSDAACSGLSAASPGETFRCVYEAPATPDAEGVHLFSSVAAPVGGEGDGGSLTHGLFGAVAVEPPGSRWYRSQVTKAAMDTAWPRLAPASSARQATLDYAAVDPGGVPVLAMARALGPDRAELVHSDLNAVVVPPPGDPAYPKTEEQAFREFVVIFHDELKTFYADPFAELGTAEQLSGVRDGFAINYGSSGMGAILLANRKGIGPAADCVECLYEEFFLGSWANGDPALREIFPDDPSNVHHAYLNDRVVFRNLHAGPKETHVFHLHAHQWLAGDGKTAEHEPYGSYLDSQTIAPQQGFTYKIYHGGMTYRPGGGYGSPAGEPFAGGRLGQWVDLGAGNRNRTPGDSIFHCHLYPHFAQGMWALWRVHDVLEDGRRFLPDGQEKPGASVAFERAGRTPRPGTDLEHGPRPDDTIARGTPVPALLPLPNLALPPLPSYGENGLPGYPFFIAGKPGRRAPQPPLDFARDAATGAYQDGGLPRHVVEKGVRRLTVDDGEGPVAADPADPRWGAKVDRLVRRSVALADFTAEYESLDLETLPYDGAPRERVAMKFHAGTATQAVAADGSPATPDRGRYRSLVPVLAAAPAGQATLGEGRFWVNGGAPKPGAPFADPCATPEVMRGLPGPPAEEPGTKAGALPAILDGDGRIRPIVDRHYPAAGPFLPDPGLHGFRRYEVSAVQADLVANKLGWHDPQGRINVLSRDAGRVRGGDAQPFFFRAFSGECIEFRHTNRLPNELALDDFQVRTPTDTIGQHIHLVKFDVLASDGSANGWNYEDGTFAAAEVKARLCAARKGAAHDAAAPVSLRGREALCRPDAPFVPREDWLQTTVQRWLADPLLAWNVEQPGGEGTWQDRTLRTVFTHDHFGPSSIQQHGFYSALVIEPWGSTVAGPDITGMPMPAGDAGQATPIAASGGVGTQAVVIPPADEQPEKLHHSTREFALAIADFALLYDPRRGDTPTDEEGNAQGLDRLVAETQAAVEAPGIIPPQPGSALAAEDVRPADLATLTGRRDAIRREQGQPVAPPERPEAISQQHHDPYLVNYKGEPLPLRLGQTGKDNPGDRPACFEDHVPGVLDDRPSVRALKPGELGDPAFAFSSLRHGEPCTPILEAFENERIQFRLIQGAQEVQHTFTVEGLAFRRSADQKMQDRRLGDDDSRNLQAGDDNPFDYVTAQEVGISEHFEIDGLASGTLAPAFRRDGKTVPAPARLGPTTDHLYHFGSQDAIWNGAWGLLRVRDPKRREELDPPPAAEAGPLKPLPGGSGNVATASTQRLDRACPAGAPFVYAYAVALQVRDVLGNGRPLRYDREHGLFDPDALVLAHVAPSELVVENGDLVGLDWAALEARLKSSWEHGVQPYVLRANAGECVKLTYINGLDRAASGPWLPDARGDALMPRIVPLNVDTGGAAGDCTRAQSTSCAEVKPSRRLALSVVGAKLINAQNESAAIGINPGEPVPPSAAGLSFGSTIFYTGRRPPGSPGVAYAFGALPIKDLGDVLGHGAHGLLGALIVEPWTAHYPGRRRAGEVLDAELPSATACLDPLPSTSPPDKNSTIHSNEKRMVICVDPVSDGPMLAAARITLGKPVAGGRLRPVYDERVIVYQDGLNLWGGDRVRGMRPIGDCPICDDSYDLGEKGISYGSAPLFARLAGTADPIRYTEQKIEHGVAVNKPIDLNGQVFPPDFFDLAQGPVSTPTITGEEGVQLVVRVLHPQGRARQRTFLALGQPFPDLRPGFGSPSAPLVAPGKAFSARIDDPAAGRHIYRDGPAPMLGGGAWGWIEIAPRPQPAEHSDASP